MIGRELYLEYLAKNSRQEEVDGGCLLIHEEILVRFGHCIKLGSEIDCLYGTRIECTRKC